MDITGWAARRPPGFELVPEIRIMDANHCTMKVLRIDITLPKKETSDNLGTCIGFFRAASEPPYGTKLSLTSFKSYPSLQIETAMNDEKGTKITTPTLTLQNSEKC